MQFCHFYSNNAVCDCLMMPCMVTAAKSIDRYAEFSWSPGKRKVNRDRDSEELGHFLQLCLLRKACHGVKGFGRRNKAVLSQLQLFPDL